MELTCAQHCNNIFDSKKYFENHVSDIHISHFSSSESNVITSKKGEGYETCTIRVDTG